MTNRFPKDNNVDAVVTFEPGILELVVEDKKDLSILDKKKISIQIYGTGSTSKIISSYKLCR